MNNDHLKRDKASLTSRNNIQDFTEIYNQQKRMLG